MSRRRVYIDVETLPEMRETPEDCYAWFREQLAEAPSATGEDLQKAWRGTALDPGRGRLLAVGVAVDGEPVTVHYATNAGDELRMLDELRCWLNDRDIVTRNDATWVAWNAPFDMSFVRARSAVWGLDLPAIIPWRRWDERVCDLREVWLCGRRDSGRYATAMRSGLADAARALGFGGKAEGITGATVLDAWLAGRHDEIESYCARDVELLRMIDRRLLP